MLMHFAIALTALAAGPVAGQLAAPEVHTTGWNSTASIPSDLGQAAGISDQQVALLETMLHYDRTQLANGGAHQDDFYKVPAFKRGRYPEKSGMVLKVDKLVDTAPFSFPAKLAMSRIMYTSTNLNGTHIPASGYILWPYHRKTFDKGPIKGRKKAPVVLWEHGTSGYYANGAPSTDRTLFYHYLVPFALAQAGYIVVAPDYAGLGVDRSWDGSFIPHYYLEGLAHARDALNLLRAARTAFPDRLTDEYAVLGHSQGGGVAWGIIDRLAEKDTEFRDLLDGYLGTVLLAPATDAFGVPEFLGPAWYGKNLPSFYPGFELEKWFTPSGLAKLDIVNSVEASQLFTTSLFTPADVQPGWRDTWEAKAYRDLADASGRPFSGPVVIYQGTEDPGVIHNVTEAAFVNTCRKYPGDMEFVSVPEAGHFGIIEASKQKWLQWIEDRFSGKPLCRPGFHKSTMSSFLPAADYHALPNSYPLWAGAPQFGYELPTRA